MKKIGISLLALFFLFTIAYAVMQGDIGKEITKRLLTKALEDSGYQVQIERIDGVLPNQIHLKGVKIEGDEVHLTIERLSLRPVLWRLLKKEIAFTDIQAEKISIQTSTPFDLQDGKFRINQKRVLLRGQVMSWDIFFRYHLKTKEAELSAVNDLISLKGDAQFLPFFSANVLIRSDFLLGSIDILKEDKAYQAKAVWQVLRNPNFGPFEGTATGTYLDGKIQGLITAEAFSKAEFDLVFSPDKAITGTAELKIENLQSLNIPETYGTVQAKAIFDQELQIEALFNEFYLKDFYAKTFFANVTGNQLSLNGETLQWKQLELQKAEIKTSIQQHSPYTFLAEGSLRHPFTIESEGTWSKEALQINQLNGTFLNSPFHLNEPVEIKDAEETFEIPNARFTIGDGSMEIDVRRKKNDARATVHLEQIPLDFLSINPLEVVVGGTLSLNATLVEKNNRLSAQFNAVVNQLEPMPATGYFEGSFSKDRLLVRGNLNTREEPLLNFDLALPIHFSIWPFNAEILYHKDAHGQIAFNGQVGEILDYFDMGASKLEGHLKGSLTFKNTLYRPLVKGQFTFENGLYENYYSGTQLANMQAEIVAEKNSIYLRSLTAQDHPGTGTFEAKGRLRLLPSHSYPYQINAEIQNLQFASIDLVQASATGKVRLEGNALSAIAKGDIYVHECALTIPDHIPRPLPNLEVTYRNAIHPVAPPQKNYQPYPIHLDLNIAAPTNITISGRGLESNWKGDFHLGGTYASLAAKGTLELIEGEFNFSSRSFKLIEGSLAFSGIEHQMPYLNLAGQMDTKGITITARLKGPLDDPQITLLSNPPLPLGSIMSHLLFGQDISEIGGFQALQLATSLASLAGTGPDVMETTRKSLGVDRLQVITEPTEEGGETVALQVGKYISKGVLVSFSQGTDESSTNISVEIELKNNFIFQIESDQRQEQGRFTLKWNLNY